MKKLEARNKSIHLKAEKKTHFCHLNEIPFIFLFSSVFFCFFFFAQQHEWE